MTECGITIKPYRLGRSQILFTDLNYPLLDYCDLKDEVKAYAFTYWSPGGHKLTYARRYINPKVLQRKCTMTWLEVLVETGLSRDQVTQINFGHRLSC